MDTNNQQELNEYLQNLQQLEGKDMYKEIIEANLLCGVQQWVRVLREVNELNKEFHTLRTYMGAVSDLVGVLHFLIYPADGAFADKPLCGRVLIPATYPQNPPVVHLLTPTGRYNVDVYHCYGQKQMLKHMHSSMCFDVLRAKLSGGVWESTFTISCLMASLIQSIVSMKVPQQYGSDKEEFVTMETLDMTNKYVSDTYKAFGKVMPTEQPIKKIVASPVPTKTFSFPKSFESLKADKYVTVESQGVYLQVPSEDKSKNVYSIGFDLTDLKSNPYTVFSIVLTNDPDDMLGKKSGTIIVRNGVTATAAKKVRGGTLNWFYHGKPMNQSNLKLIVTVGYDQFCISYIDGDNKIVHGDCPVSFLTNAEIGDAKSSKFYLCALMKNKGSGKVVKVNTFVPEYGYLHPIYTGNYENIDLGLQEELSKKKTVVKQEETKKEDFPSLGGNGQQTSTDKPVQKEEVKTENKENTNTQNNGSGSQLPRTPLKLPRTPLKLTSKVFEL